jgi:hypothetical protein
VITNSNADLFRDSSIRNMMDDMRIELERLKKDVTDHNKKEQANNYILLILSDYLVERKISTYKMYLKKNQYKPSSEPKQSQTTSFLIVLGPMLLQNRVLKKKSTKFAQKY